MTTKNALTFIKRGQTEKSLRSRLNKAATLDELTGILTAEKLVFSAADLDEAYHHRLTQCQEEKEASQLKDFKMWWELLNQVLQPSANDSTCR